MEPPMSRCALLFSLLLVLAALPFLTASKAADDLDQLTVGVQKDGRIVVPTNQILKPAGVEITFPGRPVDLALTSDGKTLVVKNMKDLVFIDVSTSKLKQTLPLSAAKGGTGGFGVVGVLVQGDRVYATDAKNDVRIALRQQDGSYKWDDSIELPRPRVSGVAHPAGVARLSADQLMVACTRSNSVQLVNTHSGDLEATVRVGVAPYGICVARPDKVYVSNWGGNPPKKDDPQAETSKTPVRIDPKTGVADQGTISVLVPAPGKWKEQKTITVGLHPCGMTLSPKGKFLYVANANSDTVSVIDVASDEVVDTIGCRPEAKLPFGSGSNALALSPDGGTLYVANGTNNCIAVVRLGARVSEVGKRFDKSFVAGLIPTAWYPGAVTLSADGKTLFVANIKGHGSLSQPRPVAKGKNSHDHLGSVSIIPVPEDDKLAAYTKEVIANNRLAYSLAGLDKPRPDVKPIPVPQRHGEPSRFKHVIYIIKENRTYDQLFGDMKEGNGDPNLVMFGEKVTPNHHKLAREFTLFDNFYCSGVLSADGHTWVNEAIVSDYLEKAFGGFARSYPDAGQDPLAYVPTGFLWNNALEHKKTFRNYGEYIENTFEPKNAKWIDLYNDYKNRTTKVKVKATPNIKMLDPYTHPGYPWFPLLMPDVYRARLFIDELKEYEKKGEFPNLVYVTLPCDHTDGMKPNSPSPRAMVADNDLALGQIVEAVSKSKFWPDTCIFIVEDDPQAGFDHVDGHRTVALVISPYTKRKYVDHTSYNQTGMVKSIELILGLPPMNQLDLSATAMRNCFTDKADLTPYVAVPNEIPLDEMNKPFSALTGVALHWAKESLKLNLDEGDKADEETLNRILWYSVKGDAKYPGDE
jgi:YVTN family beta-propeller protein